MNRKVRKLLKNPKQFFLDSRPFRRIASHLADATASEVANKPAADDKNPVPDIHVPGFEPFDLVGDAWLDAPEKPVAILWGFNPWKRKFVSQFLSEYRTAFARAKTPWSKQKTSLSQHSGLTFIVWGMNEPDELTDYAQETAIPIFRMEDGFIRSAALGSAHTTALSLVLDKSGIYFDASKPSDLENLLNEFDFEQSPALLGAAQSLLKVVRELRISKYNLASLRSPDSLLGPKFKRRILVLGQVESDASIRYGKAAGWTNLRLIELAKADNPGADIIYKPHPDVVQGFRSDSSSLQKLQQLCHILSEPVVLADLFEVVDHVYTITSLSGFEALIHGLPVTTVGCPFYAGWGLTDDRAEIDRRNRKLSLIELFCATYLLYPRYLPNLQDNVRGCLGSALRVTADRLNNLTGLLTEDFLIKNAPAVSQSNFWPALLRPKVKEKIDATYGKKLFSLIPVRRILASCSEAHYRLSVAYLLAGAYRKSAAFPRLLNELRSCIRTEQFGELISELWQVSPSAELLDQWAWYCEKAGDFAEAKQALAHLAFDAKNLPPHDAKAHGPAILKLAQFELRRRNLPEARKLHQKALLLSGFDPDALIGLAEIARLSFEFRSAAALSTLVNHFAPSFRQAKGWVQAAHASSLCNEANACLDALSFATLQNPQAVESVAAVEEVLNRVIGELPYADALLAGIQFEEAANPIARAKAHISAELPALAERTLLAYDAKPSEELKYCLTLSMAYSYQGKLEQAKALVCNILPRHPVQLLYSEGLRLAVIKNDYAWGQKLLEDAATKDIDVGDIYHRKIALGLGDIKGSYLSFRNMRATKLLASYLGSRYVQSANAIRASNTASALVVSCFGPGDEIRFASLYPAMRERCGIKLSFTCDPRLHPMLQRSYPDFEFIPVGRIRSLAWLENTRSFDQLPGSDLHTFFDNAGWAAACGADRVTLTSDLLGDVIGGYSSFRGSPYLKADPEKVKHWQRRLNRSDERRYVGIAWRSSLTTYSRNEHYFAVEQLLPLFETTDACFVNLQYDECEKELAWLEERYPGRIINFADLDQFNDLDNVAALMCSLDLVIAPATTVVELAGALGCPTLLLSNSSELHWRKLPGTYIDTWHNSVTHVEGKHLGDKQSLAVATANKLLAMQKPAAGVQRLSAEESVMESLAF